MTDNNRILELFLSAKRIEGCSEKTLYYYNNSIREMFVNIDKPILEISADDLRGYLMNVFSARGWSKTTLNNNRRILSSLYKWLEDEDYIHKSPMRRIHNVKVDKKIKETITEDGIEMLRCVCDNIRDVAIIDLLTATGMRVGELVGLNRSSIDFNARECIVFGKGNKERVVYFNATTENSIRDYLDKRIDDNPALFVSLIPPYERIRINTVGVSLREIGKRAGLKKIHPHKFRRTMATRAIGKGMPIEQVQKILGHVRIDTTMLYAMVDQDNVKNSYKNLFDKEE